MKPHNSLTLTNSDLNEISALKYNTNIQELTLDKIKIDENLIQTISRLTQLRRLSITDTDIHDLSFITSLKNLEEIDISGTQINDISPLGELTNLKCIVAHDTKISSLQPLRNLKKLTELSMERAEIMNIEPLSDIKTLEIIDFYGNKEIKDISPLAKLENLKNLSIKGTSVNFPNSLNCLEHLRNLEELTVNNEIEFAAKLVLKQVEKNRTKPNTDFFEEHKQIRYVNR